MSEVHRCPAGVVDWFAAQLAAVADGRLVAVYLHGSAVLGGWVPSRSDVDILIVAADDAGDETLDSMVRVIAEGQPRDLRDGFPAPRIETSIVKVAAARDPGPPWPFLRHVVTDPNAATRVAGPDKGGDRDLLMHYAACRAAGYSAFGPQPRELIGPIPREDILAYLADELIWGLANAPERYGVLNACRAQLYLTDGDFVSKIAGGEAALLNGTGPIDVITRALAQQRGTETDHLPAADAIAFIEETVALLRRGVSAAGIERRGLRRR